MNDNAPLLNFSLPPKSSKYSVHPDHPRRHHHPSSNILEFSSLDLRLPVPCVHVRLVQTGQVCTIDCQLFSSNKTQLDTRGRTGRNNHLSARRARLCFTIDASTAGGAVVMHDEGLWKGRMVEDRVGFLWTMEDVVWIALLGVSVSSNGESQGRRQACR